jgi:hypothetical protein
MTAPLTPSALGVAREPQGRAPSPAPARRLFVGGMTLAVLAHLGLLTYSFLRYPLFDVGTSPKPAPLIWFGPVGETVFALGYSALLDGLYLWAALRGSRRPRGGHDNRIGAVHPWQMGSLIGLATGAAVFALILVAYAFPRLMGWQSIQPLLLVGGCACAGLVGALYWGRVGAGTLAGVWCALVAALLAALSVAALDNLFAPALLHTDWAKLPVCAQYRGNALIGCVMGDDLGSTVTILLLLPLLGAISGTVSGLLGALLARVRGRPSASLDGDVRAPLIFVLSIIALLAVSAVAKLY